MANPPGKDSDVLSCDYCGNAMTWVEGIFPRWNCWGYPSCGSTYSPEFGTWSQKQPMYWRREQQIKSSLEREYLKQHGN